MIIGIQDFYYNVSDMDRAVQFDTEVLGMNKKFGDQYWTSLDAWGINLGLHWTGGADVPKTPRDSHGQNAGGTLTLKSDDIVADRLKLKEAGVVILGEADAPWGHMVVFEDLDGNVLKIMKSKY